MSAPQLPAISLDDPAENFIVASKLSPWLSESFAGPAFEQFRSDGRALDRFGLPSAVIESTDSIELEPGPEHTRSALSAVFRDRVSASDFGPGGTDFQTLSNILLETVMVSPDHGRGAPSAGGLYPLDLYLCATGVSGLDEGFYSIDPFGQRLYRLPVDDASDARAFLHDALLYPELAAGACAAVFFVASFLRSRVKYGQRGYRFAFLEAGHLAQAMTLSAQSYGLASCPVGGYHDRLADDFFGLDGVEQTVIYCLVLGRPGTGAP
ncbi:SagB family peptide dehydrogenase [Acaricomes phytoseiuli]|uniref:SagB family peptide dehydrogenase n=1 Tax=Acaricomes phytoseiuli TaxID=291968 RepID=UPI0022214CB9|nr:SagB family peptide dehydrogenase [Acaricomes phytoseiuli]MCW1249739.1 SagB family peptide dehydrogenase [Acaricomes phytoseiuli]